MKLPNVRCIGTLKIVTSGYSDRFVSSIVNYEFEISFNVWVGVNNRTDIGLAIAAHLGIDAGNGIESCALIAKHIRDSPFNQWVTAEYLNETVTIKSTPVRLSAGIARQTADRKYFTGSNEEYVALVDTLTKHELAAVCTGLDECNRRNARTGKPVVSFIDSRFI